MTAGDRDDTLAEYRDCGSCQVRTADDGDELALLCAEHAELVLEQARR